MKTTLVVTVSLDWPTYEEDISSAIRDEVLNEVRKEVRKQSAALRDEVAKALKGRQEELVKKAISAMGGL